MNTPLGVMMILMISVLAQANIHNCPSAYEVTATQLNVRSQPKKPSDILGTVKRGDKICVDKFSGKWAKTKYGWISGRYLKLMEQDIVSTPQTNMSGVDKNTNNIYKTNVSNSNNSGYSQGTRNDAFDQAYRENQEVISKVKYLIYDAYRTYGENDVFKADLDEYLDMKNKQQQPVVQSEVMNVIKKAGQKDIQIKKDLNREQIRKERAEAKKGFSAKGYRYNTKPYKPFKIPSKVFRNINSVYKKFSDQYGKAPVVIQLSQNDINQKEIVKFWSVNRTRFNDPKGTGSDVVSPTSQPLRTEAEEFMADLELNAAVTQKMVKEAMVKAIKSANELIGIKNMNGSSFPKYSISQGFDYSMFAKYPKPMEQDIVDNPLTNNKFSKDYSDTSLLILFSFIIFMGTLLFIALKNNNKGLNKDKLKHEGNDIYDIRDVWSGLKYATTNFFSVEFIAFFGGALVLGSVTNAGGDENKMIAAVAGTAVLMVMVLIQSIIIYLANRRYVIDLDTGLIIFPRSDMENSILAILLLFPYWNLMRTQTIHSSEIENVYIDTKRWSTKHKVVSGYTSKGKSRHRTETKRHIRYTINITGTFGSANLPFVDRQKRDEVRNAIQQSVKLHTGKNVDRKVAEF